MNIRRLKLTTYSLMRYLRENCGYSDDELGGKSNEELMRLINRHEEVKALTLK